MVSCDAGVHACFTYFYVVHCEFFDGSSAVCVAHDGVFCAFLGVVTDEEGGVVCVV